MTITKPTAVSMKLRFPEFASADNSAIEFAIEEASRSIGDTWLAGDVSIAYMYLAAHYLSVSIQRSSGGGSSQQIVSERIGEISVTYAQNANTVSGDDDNFESTLYGMRFLKLARLNFPAVMVI